MSGKSATTNPLASCEPPQPTEEQQKKYADYWTPGVVVDGGTKYLAAQDYRASYKRVLEPGAGRGLFLKAVRQHLPGIQHTTAVEIQPCYAPIADQAVCANFLDWQTADLYELVIGNLPFKWSQVFVEKSLRLLAPGGVAVFLLPLRFLGSIGRLPLWKREQCSEIWVVPERIGFIEGGGGAPDNYAWFVYREDYVGQPTVLHPWGKDHRRLDP